MSVLKIVQCIPVLIVIVMVTVMVAVTVTVMVTVMVLVMVLMMVAVMVAVMVVVMVTVMVTVMVLVMVAVMAVVMVHHSLLHTSLQACGHRFVSDINGGHLQGYCLLSGRSLQNFEQFNPCSTEDNHAQSQRIRIVNQQVGSTPFFVCMAGTDIVFDVSTWVVWCVSACSEGGV